MRLDTKIIISLVLCSLFQDLLCARLTNYSDLLRSLTDSVVRRSPCCYYVDPEVYMNASQLVTSKGYPFESYTVQTKDGFLLGLQRIPHGRQKLGRTLIRPVVFLQHGLLSSSTDWLDNLANESLAYILADAGFDVWLGNMRGNTYSKSHVRFHPNQREFWSWSWDEMAEYDLPAMIDYALFVTKQQSLFYVGHSQGTTIMFAHASENPDFSKKIEAFLALGPVASVGSIQGAVKYLTYIVSEVELLFDIFGYYDFLPNNDIMKILASTICQVETRIICENLIFLIAGFDQASLNVTRLPVYVAHTPAGTSVQNMVHFAQMVRSSNFQKYDYGNKEDNIKHYGQPSPPLYRLSNVNVSTYLFSGENDWLADRKDVQLLVSELPNKKLFVEIPRWDHLDFIWGLSAPNLLYSKMIAIMRSLANQ